MLAGGPPPPPALGNWIQLLLAAHKGPIEGLRGGSAAPAFSPRCSSRLPKRHSIPAQAGGERGSAAPRRKKAGAGGEKGGAQGQSPPCSGTGLCRGDPQDLAPGFSLLFSAASQHPAPRAMLRGLPRGWLLPGGEDTKVAFCGVGRATAVATSDRAAGQSPTRRPLAGGTVPVPSPAVPTGRGLCQLPAGAVPRGLGDASTQEGARDRQCRPQTHSGTRVVPGRERGEARGGTPEASLLSPSPSARRFPVPVRSPRGGT